MSAAKCLLSVMLVLVAAACAAHAQEKIKMCGRQLVRHAVLACGNSRLRRSLMDEEPEQLQQHFISAGNQEPPRNKSQAEEPTPDAPESEEEKDEGFSMAPHWHPMVSRIRRSSMKISADICCEKGCSMKDLIQFC